MGKVEDMQDKFSVVRPSHLDPLETLEEQLEHERMWNEMQCNKLADIIFGGWWNEN